MSVWELPTSLSIGGVDFAIRTDFRAVLDILKYFNDPEYDEDEQWLICLTILYEDFESIPSDCYEEAVKKAVAFIDMQDENAPVQPSESNHKPSVMDWEQDAPLIISAINRVVGREIRQDKYMHWWTFLSAYMEIGDCSYTHILNIRTKKATGKKLEKWEQDFIRENKEIVLLKKKMSREEEEEEQRLRDKFG